MCIYLRCKGNTFINPIQTFLTFLCNTQKIITRENGGDRASYITYLWYAGVEVGSAGGERMRKAGEESGMRKAWAEKTQTRLYRVAVQPRGVLSMSVTGRGGRGSEERGAPLR